MTLLIDLGNTRLKWAQHGAGAWQPGALMHRERALPQLLDDAWRDLAPPARVVMTSVASADTQAALDRWLQNRWHLSAQRLTAQREQLGIKNTYRDPSALGADRWAALLGARAACSGDCIVVGCGTA